MSKVIAEKREDSVGKISVVISHGSRESEESDLRKWKTGRVMKLEASAITRDEWSG